MLDPKNVTADPPADTTVELIGELVNCDLLALIGVVEAGLAEQEAP